ncbi:hypothetical protein [Sandaracinus amylolyticus]|uniref:Uncharacterized protein n=1 Tax=Sandaracinus amylolyticus TaxID=927083 RepID=A0A0F6YJQ9_9BACT|nr:hypothetical protein [Sandaracinus amylolyticus]AKF07291.1 hypothetical protein DB32_004440 [Sandaracinus amylolyticus]
MDEDLERAWNDVLAAWDDGDRHKRFLVLAETTDRLAEAGRRYREVKEHDPERRAEAERRIDEILGRAMARMKVIEQRDEKPSRSKLEWVAFGVSAALIAAALYQLLGR